MTSNNLSDAELERALAASGAKVETLEKNAGKSYTWEIVITIGVIIIAIIAGIFIWLWSRTFAENLNTKRLLNKCNQDISADESATESNNTSLDACETESKEIQATSLGTYTFDTRKFNGLLKRFIKVDKPVVNTSDIGIYPFSSPLVPPIADQKDKRFIDNDQYPKTDKIDKIDYLYGFIYKPPPPYPNTTVEDKLDTCAYWQVINRLKTDWSWELGYQTSSDLNGRYGSTYYRVANGVGDTDKIPDGGIFLNSGDVHDTDIGTSTTSCIGLSSLCLLTITDAGGNSTQQSFTPPQYNFNITIFHPEEILILLELLLDF